MLQNFIWAVGVRPSLDFGCAQAGLRINAQPLRNLHSRKCVPWERLDFRRRRTSAYVLIVNHRTNFRAPISYTPLCRLNSSLLCNGWPILYVAPSSPLLLTYAMHLPNYLEPHVKNVAQRRGIPLSVTMVD